MSNYYNDFIGRMNDFLSEAGLSKVGIASEMNLNQTTVNGYFMKEGVSKRFMPISFLADFAYHYPAIDLNWAILGKTAPDKAINADKPKQHASLETDKLLNEIESLKSQNERLVKLNESLTESVNLLSKMITERNEQ